MGFPSHAMLCIIGCNPNDLRFKSTTDKRLRAMPILGGALDPTKAKTRLSGASRSKE